MIIFMGVRSGIERYQDYDAIRWFGYCCMYLFNDKTGSNGWCKVFPDSKSKNFSWMTVVVAMGQMFYSLSIAMGILVTFGSYEEIFIEHSTKQLEFFDTGIALSLVL